MNGRVVGGEQRPCITLELVLAQLVPPSEGVVFLELSPLADRVASPRSWGQAEDRIELRRGT